MIIAVDFDGTIVDHNYPRIGLPVPMALYYLKAWHDQSIDIILWTVRSESLLDDAVQYMKDANIVLYGVNKNPAQHSWSRSEKVVADVYIDDAAVGCPTIHPEGFLRPCVDWVTVAELLNLTP